MPAKRNQSRVFIVAVVAVVLLAVIGGGAYYMLNESSEKEYRKVFATDGRLIEDVAAAAADVNDALLGSFPDLDEAQLLTVESAVETFTAALQEARDLPVPSDLELTQDRLIRGFEHYVEAGELTLQAIAEEDGAKLQEAAGLFNDGSENIRDADELLDLKRRALNL